MGTQWRRVEIIGRCNQTDVPSLEAALRPGESNSNFHPLCSEGKEGGLPNWAREQIHAIGSLAERGYSLEDVADALKELCRKAPTLEVAIHVGDWDKSTKCVGTVVGLGAANGQEPKVKVLPPQVEVICALPNENLAGMLLDAMKRHPL